MNETSRLAIVVDTANAEAKLKAFTAQLKAAEDAGRKLGSSSGQASTGLNSQAQSASKAAIEQNKLATSISNATAAATRARTALAGEESALNRAAASAQNLVTAQNKVTTSATQAATAQNRLATSATQVQVGNNRVLISAEQLSTAQFKVVTASNQAAASNNRLSVSAVQVATAEQRLATATAQTAAANTRASIATVNHANAQQRLVAAALATATAEQRLAAQTTRAAAEADRAALATLRLAQANARAAADADRASGALNRATVASRGLYQQASKLYMLMNSGLVIYGGLAVVKEAAEMQNLSNQIRLVTKDEKEYAGVKQQVIAIANKNYNSISATTSLYQKSARALGNLGKTQQEALKFTNAISTAMRVGGRSAGEQAAALLQLGQAMGAGVIMGDEFRSISENAPILLDLVAKRMGVMQGELKKMSADGLITAEIMYDAVVENEKMLEDIAKGMPITMGQAFILVKNKYTETVDDMFNKTGGFSDKLSGLMVGIVKNFDTITNTIKVAGVLAFLNFAGSVNVAARAMAALNFVMGLNPLVRIAMLVMGVATAFYGLDDVMDTTTIVFSDLMELIGTGLQGLMEITGDAVDYMSGKFQEGANNGAQSYQGFFDNTQKGFAGFLQGTSRTIAAASAVIVSFWQWLGNGMLDIAKNIGNIFIWLSNKVKGIFTSLGETINDALNKAVSGYDWVAKKANGILDFVKSPLIFKVVGEVEWRDPKYKDTPYLQINDKSMQSFIPKNLDFFMGGVDNYWESVAGRVESKRNSTDLSGNIGTGLINPDSPAGMAAMAARKELEEAKKAAKKTAAASKKKEKRYAEVNKTVLAHAAQYKYAEIEAEYASLPKGILAAIEMQESRGVSNARGPQTRYGVAKGAFQFLDGTAKQYGVKNSDNVEQSAKGAAKYLDYLIRMFNSQDVGIAAYNAGEGNVAKHGGHKGKLPPFKETKGYVKGVNEYLNFMGGGIDGSYDVYGDIVAAQKKYDEAMKVALKEAKERSDILKEYESTPEKIERELGDRLTRISDAGFGKAQEESLIGKAIEMANRESLIYTKSLNDLADANDDFRKTELKKIEKNRENLKFEAKIHPFLSLPENEAVLTKVLEDIDYAMDYEVAKDKIKNDRLINDLYAFKKTERQIFEDEWKSRLAEAGTMTDEIKFVRIKALNEEMAIRKELLNLSEIQNRLDLNKYKMTATEYMVQNIALQRARINQDPTLTDEQKREQSQAAGQPISDAVSDMMDKFNPKSQLQILDEQHAENLESIRAYEEEIGLIEEGARTERFAAQQAYEIARAQLLLGQGESLFASLASASKNMLGEQSATYRTMFALQQSFVMASAGINMYKAISDAMAEGATMAQKFAAAGVIAAEFSTIIGAVSAMQPKGFKSGGYTGNGGVSDVAGVVHGQEFVFDAEATRRIGTGNLEAMRSGQSIDGGDVNINVNVDAKGNAQVSGDNERMGRDMANGIKAVVMDVMRKEKRQGGMLYGA